MNLSINNISTAFHPKKNSVAKNQNTPVNFGTTYYLDEDEPQKHPFRHTVKNAVKSITGSMLNMVGFNVALYFLQDIVSKKLLVGKINNHFTEKINDNGLLDRLAGKMKADEKLNTNMFCNGNSGQAYYNHAKNEVVVGSKEFSSLFHELGHAKIENKTKFLRMLQRGRGNYTLAALALYTLANENKNNGSAGGITGFISKHPSVIPILAYSPELITEGMATKYGLDFLKKNLEKTENGIKTGLVSKNLYKNIKGSYLACFGTYLFFPISIILLDKLDNWAHRRSN